jgi:dUTP pyrophosphatase
MTKVKFTMAPDCQDLIPKKAHFDDAAFDLRSRVDIVLPSRKSTLVPTGLFIELPINFEAQIRPRSGLALKHDIMITNSPGTVDAGYRGEVGIIMYNGSENEFPIKRGDRVAQMVICQLPEIELIEVDELAPSDRGEGGFGSTGKK